MNTAAVKTHMTKYPVIAPPDMTSYDALKLMKSFSIRHLPVVEDERVLGIISQRDLFRATALGAMRDMPVSEIMTKNPYVVPSSAALSDVTREMAAEKYGCAVVVNAEGDVLGIFTTTDALRILSSYLDQEEKSAEIRQERVMEDWLEWDCSQGE